MSVGLSKVFARHSGQEPPRQFHDHQRVLGQLAAHHIPNQNRFPYGSPVNGWPAQTDPMGNTLTADKLLSARPTALPPQLSGLIEGE